MSTKCVQRLKTQTLKAARGFSDYNFRNYFVKHTKDRFDNFDASRASADQLTAFAAESEKMLKQMRRMALINTMYVKQRVVLDPRAPRQSGEDETPK